MKILLNMAVMVLGIGCASAIVSCASRKAEAIKGKPFTPSNERIANGERLYMMHCQKCHPGGEAGLGPAVNSNPAPQFVKRFQMRHGLGVMPSFKKGEISKKDLKDISKYLRAWKHY
ncbi:MAG TPA: cytochrome c [Chitinophagaceae bacterium]|nr:cytochrome c [Chitinophagaceae bacterium]